MAKIANKGVTLFCLLASLTSLAMAQGSGMMGPGTAMPTMPGYQGHELAENVVVPQFAVGDHYTTTMVLLNMGNIAQMPWMTPQALELMGDIYFYHQDGTPLQVSINGANAVSHYPFRSPPQIPSRSRWLHRALILQGGP